MWVSKQSRSSEYFVIVFRTPYINAHTTPVRIYSEPYKHKFCAVHIFLEYHPTSSNITRYQVSLRVRAWLHDSAGDIDFYQMSFSQSESIILHLSIIMMKYILDNLCLNPRGCKCNPMGLTMLGFLQFWNDSCEAVNLMALKLILCCEEIMNIAW